MERAVPRAARGAALPEPCRRPVRAVAGHPAQHPGDRGLVGRGPGRVDGDDRRRSVGHGAVLRVGGRLPVGVPGAVAAWPGDVRRAVVSHQPVAGRRSGLHRAAGRADRHRVYRHPGRARDRRRRRAPVRVPADRELRGAQQEPRHRPGVGGRVQGGLPVVPEAGAGVVPRRADRRDRTAGAGRAARRGAADPHGAMAGGRRDAVPRRVHRRARRPGRQRHRGGVHAGPDQGDGRRSRGGRAAAAAHLPGRGEAAVPERRLLRDVQPAQRDAGGHQVGAADFGVGARAAHGGRVLRAGRAGVRDRVRRDLWRPQPDRRPRRRRGSRWPRRGRRDRAPTWASPPPGSRTCSS